MKHLILIATIFVLTGCFGDPFAMTRRTEIRANAEVAIAQAEKEAAIGVAEAEASKSKAWATVAIPLAIVIMGGVAVVVIVHWQGKIYHTRAVQGQTSRLLTVESEQELKLYARRLGGRLAIDDKGYKVYLPNGQMQRLLPVKDAGSQL